MFAILTSFSLDFTITLVSEVIGHILRESSGFISLFRHNPLGLVLLEIALMKLLPWAQQLQK